MYVQRLITENWQGKRNIERVIDKPSSAQVEAAIAALDADRKTLVLLEADDEVHMAMGGGGDHYVVYATYDNVIFWNLISMEPTTETMLLFVGGQEGEYSLHHIVSAQVATQAALTFLREGTLDAALTWHQDR